MAKWSGYQRFCSLARGLDIIGERWTLLIIQELSFGPLRYNQLKARLPGIGSNVLSDRLRKLEQHEIAQRVESKPTNEPPSGVGRNVHYQLTERGERLQPAITELRKWGLDEQLMLHTPTTESHHNLSYMLPANASVNETYQWQIDETVINLTIDGTELTQRLGPADHASVKISTTQTWMTQLASGKTTWTQGRASGRVEVVGDDQAWERMLLATAQPGANPDLIPSLFSQEES